MALFYSISLIGSKILDTHFRNCPYLIIRLHPIEYKNKLLSITAKEHYDYFTATSEKARDNFEKVARMFSKKLKK